MRIVTRDKVVYSFSSQHKPVKHVAPKEKILLELADAFGGQVRDEQTSIGRLDWSKANGATGPIFVDGAAPGDTLAVQIGRIRLPQHGIVAVIPKQGVLKDRTFKSTVKAVSILDEHVHFEDGVKLKAKPMIGTIGVAPSKGTVPTGTLGRHGGNMDVKEMGAGATLYLPVFVEGALFAAGDLHAVQADGEVCVSAVEVLGEVLLSFEVVKGRSVSWPVLETSEGLAFLTCADSLDEASALAVEAAVEALMRQHNWSFEKAYMFASLAVDVRINQIVDPKKGVRAVVPKEFLTVENALGG
jgi:amidase